MTRPSPRVVITHGGVPSDDEVAAIAIAIASLTASVGVSQADDRPGWGQPPSGWARAALAEGVSGRPFTQATDVERLDRGRYGA